MKLELEREKKVIEEKVLEKETALQKKIKTIGNYVHESVPLSNDEVGELYPVAWGWLTSDLERQCFDSEMGPRRCKFSEKRLFIPS